jgi:hypothetical protein
MNDDALLEKIGKLIEPINKRLDNLDNTVAHNTTMVEAVLAGQEEIQKTAAREATVLTGFAKLTGRVNDHEERITELEKVEGIPHPHKH